jgi:hydrogenase maturation factor
MGEFDFILDTMRFSYSSVSLFETCPACFYKTYIEREDRSGNAFSDFGNVIHQTLEEYFKGNLESSQMKQYYIDNYNSFVKSEWPRYPNGMAENYYKAGLNYFDNFSFDKSLYEVVYIEESVKTTHHGINLSVKPDLILKEKSTGDYILVDYKTAKIKKTKKDKAKQLESYLRQFYLYVYFLWLERQIEVKKIIIWFIRDGKEIVEIVDAIKAQETIDWFEEVVNRIKLEEYWNHNNTKDSDYFCKQICGVRNKCEYGKL